MRLLLISFILLQLLGLLGMLVGCVTVVAGLL